MNDILANPLEGFAISIVITFLKKKIGFGESYMISLFFFGHHSLVFC
jgi:hypothetical protein